MALNEIAASLYAWDLADEGVEHILDNLEVLAGVNSVYLVGLMHKEKRPLHARFYPHNPVRKWYAPEDSRAYWIPDAAGDCGGYDAMMERAWALQDGDFLDAVRENRPPSFGFIDALPAMRAMAAIAATRNAPATSTNPDEASA